MATYLHMAKTFTILVQRFARTGNRHLLRLAEAAVQSIHPGPANALLLPQRYRDAAAILEMGMNELQTYKTGLVTHMETTTGMPFVLMSLVLPYLDL